jgi:hypothetical protein
MPLESERVGSSKVVADPLHYYCTVPHPVPAWPTLRLTRLGECSWIDHLNTGAGTLIYLILNKSRGSILSGSAHAIQKLIQYHSILY